MDENVLNQLQEYLAAYKKAAQDTPAAACPNCGHCPHCGRGGYYGAPYRAYPGYPAYPNYDQPYITWTTTGTFLNK